MDKVGYLSISLIVRIDPTTVQSSSGQRGKLCRSHRRAQSGKKVLQDSRISTRRRIAGLEAMDDDIP